jgi:hypothetical protein
LSFSTGAAACSVIPSHPNWFVIISAPTADGGVAESNPTAHDNVAGFNIAAGHEMEFEWDDNVIENK